jgi:hypothetical protein
MRERERYDMKEEEEGEKPHFSRVRERERESYNIEA